MRVLIVEDNRRLAESIRDILKHWYDCDICGDGNTGCWLLKMCIRDSSLASAVVSPSFAR